MKNFKTTEEVNVPKKLIDQVIGQDDAVNIVKKAARQSRNVLLLGNPGTGKSMLAQAMAELMPAQELEDMLAYPNRHNENNPIIKVVKTYPGREEIMKNPFLISLYAKKKPKEEKGPEPFKKEDIPSEQDLGKDAGQGRRIIAAHKNKPQLQNGGISAGLIMILILVAVLTFIFLTEGITEENKWFILAVILGFGLLGLFWRFSNQIGKRMGISTETNEPKLIVDNSGKKTAPFIDATGSKAGALFGDVKHDPLQSGGLGTPPHLRVESGAIHEANKGVLFIDEIAALAAKSQQDLLTAMQEKRFSITGQSEMSSGALVKTKPAPCDFVLAAAGNIVDMQKMHPALRSRIRGNGYEVYVQDTMKDNKENQEMLVQFVAQEITKDKKIPHFTNGGVDSIVEEARKRAGRKNRLTLNLRELGGLVRAAGDIAREENAEYVEKKHIKKAKQVAQTLEQQISGRFIEMKKDYKVFVNEGSAMGKVNGLAVLGDSSSGLVLPIVAEVTPASSKSEGKLIATGKLGEIAKEAVENVSAIIKKHIGKDVSVHDIHVQFLQTYEGVEGDSASISIAVAVLSAMEGIAVRQDTGLTGSLSVRGSVLPVGGVTAKVEAASEAGLKYVLVPQSNLKDVYIDKEIKKKVKIIPVENIVDVLEHALVKGRKRARLIKKVKGIFKDKRG